ncbi:hypothetical protein ALP50_102106 [Pseudomonas syringae pv. spinaceae]|nr:hypothetical protein ALQ58_101589 [Pseudomonas syringae pv. apii]RMT37465.1 hypothetical protein ALP50_102106 [Pseudomonas syringae pv. spinaceae]
MGSGGSNALWSSRNSVADALSGNVPANFGDFYLNKNPQRVSDEGFWNLILTMTYSHMGKPHTTIGDTSFHC